MRDYNDLLNGTSILVCHPKPRMRRSLRGLLRLIGADVTSARNPLEASTVLMRLFKEEHVPDRIVTSWWLEEPGSDTYKFWEALGQIQQATCVQMIKTVHELEITPDITILGRKSMGQDLKVAVPVAVEFFDNDETLPIRRQSALEVVLHIALKENLKRHRFQAVEDCKRAMADQEWQDTIRRASLATETEPTRYLKRQPSQI